MQPLTIIKHIDAIVDGGTCRIATAEVVMPREFILEIGEEALGHGVVITVTLAAHARDHVLLREDGAVRRGYIQDTLIGIPSVDIGKQN